MTDLVDWMETRATKIQKISNTIDIAAAVDRISIIPKTWSASEYRMYYYNEDGNGAENWFGV